MLALSLACLSFRGERLRATLIRIPRASTDRLRKIHGENSYVERTGYSYSTGHGSTQQEAGNNTFRRRDVGFPRATSLELHAVHLYILRGRCRIVCTVDSKRNPETGEAAPAATLSRFKALPRRLSGCLVANRDTGNASDTRVS